MAKRIQLRRTKGWRKPENTVNVARPTMWGNPFPVDVYGRDGAVDRFRRLLVGPMSAREMSESSTCIDGSLVWAAKYINRSLAELRGKDLACWCPLDQPCHADVLLELANPVAQPE
jgi:hypothetical protein